MKKIINRAEDYVDEFMEGIVSAYGDKVGFLNGNRRILLAKHEVKDGKVGIVTAGGSGHLPMFLGYVGAGALDGCAVGNVFASPSASNMADMIRACDRGNGVLCLFGNYGGDKLNFNMACEMVDFDEIETKMVIVRDDVASSDSLHTDRRRGVAGMVYAFKIAGAAADEFATLDEVARVAQKAVDNTRTMGVALSPCIVPEVDKPSFSIGEDKIEIGMGIHGEPGIEICDMMSADDIADTMINAIINDMPLSPGDEVSVMVNGLGATPLEELFILYRRVALRLSDIGVTVIMPHIGEYATSMEMAGASMTVIKLDPELKRLLLAPVNTPFYTNSNI